MFDTIGNIGVVTETVFVNNTILSLHIVFKICWFFFMYLIIVLLNRDPVSHLLESDTLMENISVYQSLFPMICRSRYWVCLWKGFSLRLMFSDYRQMQNFYK